MKKALLPILILTAAFFCTAFILSKSGKPLPSLKQAFAGKFHIGTALNGMQITGKDTASVNLILGQFDAIVPENCMKSGPIHPKENEYNFELADQFVDFGLKNHLFITGHALVWHSQAPRWMFTDSLGKQVSKEVLIERMKSHIHTVVGRYKGKVKGWDVLNEAIEDDGSFRKTKYLEIIGEDYIKLAFQFAHEADPAAELYYNDYSMANPGRRAGVVAMVKKLKSEGVQINGIGMQGHLTMDYPEVKEFEKSIETFGALGVKVMITEMDLSVLPFPSQNTGAEVSKNFDYQKKLNPYANGLPDSVYTAWENRYLDFFRIFLKHKDVVSRVTLWGASDRDSWKNNWPVRGRTDYPLLFDRENKPKPIVYKLIEEAKKY